MNAGRRLMLRLGRQCNNRCAHCTIADLPPLPERTTEEALAELRSGRSLHCTEVVFMRGEPTARRDIVSLVRAARELGYGLVQLQTNGRVLAYAAAVAKLLRAGVTDFEVSLYGEEAALHDAVAAAPGAFAQTTDGLRNLVREESSVLVTVPIVAANFERLPAMARLVAALGVRRLQYSFTRPVAARGRWNVDVLARLAMASPYVGEGIEVARGLGLVVTCEGVPLCHLPDDFDQGDAVDLSRFVVSDLHLRHASLAEARAETRREPEECAGCRLAARCSRTWPAYLALFGGGELIAVR